MRFLLQLLLLLFFNVALGQIQENKELLKLSPFNLGDSINKFQANILCTDADKTRKCEMYLYLPNKKDPKIIAGISFDDLKVFVGKKQVVKNIYLTKYYKGVDSSTLNAELEKDFNKLSNHFKDIYRKRKFTNGKNKLNDIEWEGYRWVTDNYLFDLQRENFKKKDGQYLFLISIMVMGK
ncbi:MAG: hypothetical protein ABIT58_01040 [Ferruginibacter sp.]